MPFAMYFTKLLEANCSLLLLVTAEYLPSFPKLFIFTCTQHVIHEPTLLRTKGVSTPHLIFGLKAKI